MWNSVELNAALAILLAAAALARWGSGMSGWLLGFSAGVVASLAAAFAAWVFAHPPAAAEVGVVALILAMALVLTAIPLFARPVGRLFARSGTLWDALRPDFHDFPIGRATTQTFHMLISAMVLFGAVIVAWAGAAGVMRSAYLLGSAAALKGIDSAAIAKVIPGCTPGCGWSSVALFGIQIVRAVGGVILIGTAAGLVGAFLGFIFGVPRPVSAAEVPPVGAGNAGASATAVGQRTAKRAWELSTNLTQVSDWLTKIIVGVGLVEFKGGMDALTKGTFYMAVWLFDARHGSPVRIAAAMVGSLVFGFIFAYLYAQLILARLIAATDYDLDQQGGPVAIETLKAIDAWDEGLVPRISRSTVVPDGAPQPSAAQIAAALGFAHVTLESLLADPDVPPERILGWARARALLNDYEGAAKAYVHLLALVVQ